MAIASVDDLDAAVGVDDVVNVSTIDSGPKANTQRGPQQNSSGEQEKKRKL